MGKSLKLAAVIALALAVAGCSAVYRNHGFVPSEAELASIIVGVDTRATVEDVLGTPSTEGVSNERGVFYVGSRWRHFGPTRPKPISREVVSISFDANDVVTNIERFGLEDGRPVVLNRRVTSQTSEISFIRQLLGSFGNISTQDIIGGPPS